MVVWLKLPEGFLLVHCVRMLVNKLKGLSIWSEMHCYVCLCLTLSLYHITYSNRYFWLECYWNSLPTMAIEIRHWFPVFFFVLNSWFLSASAVQQKRSPNFWRSFCLMKLLCSALDELLMKLPVLVATSFSVRECSSYGREDDLLSEICDDFYSGPICKMLLCLFGYECCPRIQDRLSSWETNNTLSEVPFLFLFPEIRVITEVAVCYLVKTMEKWPV